MILVTGATGFVGQHVVRMLLATGRDVRCLVRSPTRSVGLEELGCALARGDITDRESLAAAVEGCSAVVHLVAIIAGSEEQFERVMTRGTADLVRAAAAAGVERIVLMSSLGAGEKSSPAGEKSSPIQKSSPIPYYRAKGAMEDAVAQSGIAHVIIRPSFVFGSTGGALPRFVGIARRSPLIPVFGPGTQRIQPVWVDDVAACTSAALETPTGGGTFELGGPEPVTWNELWLRIARALGKRRRLVHVPFDLARPAAGVLERLPSPPLTRDQLTMLAMGDNVCEIAPAVDTFGLDLLPLDEQIERAIRR